MGLLDNLFKKNQDQKVLDGYFDLLTAYNPVFSTFEGGLYEMELTRSAIHAFATHISKLKPEVKGNANPTLAQRLQYQANKNQDISKFLYRVATIHQVENNAFIAPVFDRSFQTILGFYALQPQNVKIVKHRGTLWIVYDFGHSGRGAVEFERAGILTQYQYRDEFFGESNNPLSATMDLMHANNEGIIEGIKSSAKISFMAKLSMALKEDDILKEREKFTNLNLTRENSSGLMIFDSRYSDIQQVKHDQLIIDPVQMQQIKENVFNYFGTNEAILQNKYTSEQWNAYYEGKIEPFALQLSLVLTNMTYTEREKAHGNQILFTANRLQYLNNTEKLNTVTQLFDRVGHVCRGGR